MKRFLSLMLFCALATLPVLAQTGNLAPNGPHYNLNIIGVQKDKTADMSDGQGHTLFVPLWGNAKILLTEGPDFQTLDRNGTNGGSASFQLPNPDPDGDGVTVYSVYARALGKPDRTASMTTCALDPLTQETVCSMAVLTVSRSKGAPKFENVTKELLFIYADLDGDGVLERVPLFSDQLQDYFWSYDNKGLKLLQLRFYEIPTTVN
ncbi:MAG TPA: hypothetical protein VE398_12370 [Acidobacteriota bacterium]|nr:hypothetical protein [Acidobacteriota bacterium]